MGFISISTIFGIILGFGLFISSILISTQNYLMFLSPASFFMVIGGTLSATMISYQGRYVWRSFFQMLCILVSSDVNPKTLFSDVEKVIVWGNIIRKQGVSVFEEEIKKSNITDPFTLYSIDLISTGYKGLAVRQLLTDFTDTIFERDMVQANIVYGMAAYAPAFGMIGTLVGLVIMLDNMQGDPSVLGKGLALALLTTLYGVLFAQLICKPAALKITQKNEMLKFRHILLMEGFVLLSEKSDSLVIQDKLNSFLDPKVHFSILNQT